MGKIFKPVILFILQILIINYSYCQEEDKMVDSLTSRFEHYIETVPIEEIFIHTDREDYIAGENIWMKIYLVDRRSMKPSGRSSIAYIELLNSGNRPVLQKRFALNNGVGPGQFQLPDTLSTGSYMLRAYTNWMKNFLPYNCFMSEIRIFNVLKNETPLKETNPGISGKKENLRQEKIPDSRSNLSLTSRKLENNDLEISFSVNDNFYQNNGNQFYLFIQTHGKIDNVSPFKISEKNSKIIIPSGKLTPGINQITVFNSKGEPVSEKYTFTPSENSGTLNISVNGSYPTRGKVTLDIKPGTRSLKTPASAVLSVSVIPVTDRPVLKGIDDYLLLGTEFSLNGSIMPAKMEPTSSGKIDTILQNIKSNWIDWRIIMSGNIPDLIYKPEGDYHFLSGRLNNDDQKSGHHSETVLLCSPGREPDFQYSETDTLGNFSFNLHIDEEVKDLVIMPDDGQGKRKIILESSFPDKYLNTVTRVNYSEGSFPPMIEEMSINNQINMIYRTPGSGIPLKPMYLPLIPVRFYGKPDIELILADYVALPKMEEVFYELLPKVSLKKRGSSYKILIADRINDNRYELSPYLFLDGVKINDASIIASLDPFDVEKIDVVKDKYVVGNYLFPGIINVVTKKADFHSIPLPDYTIRFPYKVVDPAMSFPMPGYESADKGNGLVPDFRNTLYWNPAVNLDKEGQASLEFWTSDLKGRYKIYIQGITTDGQTIFEEKYFKIE